MDAREYSLPLEGNLCLVLILFLLLLCICKHSRWHRAYTFIPAQVS